MPTFRCGTGGARTALGVSKLGLHPRPLCIKFYWNTTMPFTHTQSLAASTLQWQSRVTGTGPTACTARNISHLVAASPDALLKLGSLDPPHLPTQNAEAGPGHRCFPTGPEAAR